MTTATLDKTQLEEARHAYEQTPLILQAIGDRYGVSAGKIAHLARHHHWQRYEPPMDPEQFEQDVQEAVAYAENEGLAKALRQAMKDHWHNLPKRPQGPAQKRKARKAGKARHRKTTGSSESGTNVVQFPGAVPPPQTPEIAPVDIFNVRTKAEQARLRIELGELRGAMSLQQLQGLQRTRSVIDDYEHYFRVYLRPQDYLERGTMDEATYQERLTQLRKQALLYIAPTERDTLSAALKTLVSARETLVNVERIVAGAANGRAGARPLLNPADGEPLGQTDAADLSAMDVATLRQVKGAMEALQGRREAINEPPKPPPPEPLNLGDPTHEPDDSPGR